MSKRYSLNKILGDGLTPETGFRPAIADVLDPNAGGALAFNFLVQYPPQTVPGVYDAPYCLVIAAGKNHALVEGNADIDDLFEKGNGTFRMGAISPGPRNAIYSKIAARGASASVFNNDTSADEVIDSLGKALNPSFNVRNFDAAE